MGWCNSASQHEAPEPAITDPESLHHFPEKNKAIGDVHVSKFNCHPVSRELLNAADRQHMRLSDADTDSGMATSGDVTETLSADTADSSRQAQEGQPPDIKPSPLPQESKERMPVQAADPSQHNNSQV